jgi:cold shock CspA family protein
MEESTPDLTRVLNVYEKGRSHLVSDPGFESKYSSLPLLFNDTERFEGKFIRVFEDRRYGFIECPEADPNNVFAHVSEFVDDVHDFSSLLGVWVSFSLQRDQRGSSAKAIRVLTY